MYEICTGQLHVIHSKVKKYRNGNRHKILSWTEKEWKIDPKSAVKKFYSMAVFTSHLRNVERGLVYLFFWKSFDQSSYRVNSVKSQYRTQVYAMNLNHAISQNFF